MKPEKQKRGGQTIWRLRAVRVKGLKSFKQTVVGG